MGRGIRKVVGMRYQILLPFHGDQNNMLADYYPHFRGGSRSNQARHGDVFFVAASPPLQSRACWQR